MDILLSHINLTTFNDFDDFLYFFGSPDAALGLVLFYDFLYFLNLLLRMFFLSGSLDAASDLVFLMFFCVFV